MGIETPSLESLAECHKLQNQRGDLLQAVKTIQRAGLQVMGGFIVGFDSDPHDIFERQFEFIQRSGVVTAMVGLLTALPKTRLYQRLLSEGRIVAESSGNNTEAALNFTPRLDRGFLESGYRELMTRLYEPKVYYRRIRTFLQEYRPPNQRLDLSRRDLLTVLKSLWLLGIRQTGRAHYWRLVWSTLLAASPAVPSRHRAGHSRPPLPACGRGAVSDSVDASIGVARIGWSALVRDVVFEHVPIAQGNEEGAVP